MPTKMNAYLNDPMATEQDPTPNGPLTHTRRAFPEAGSAAGTRPSGNSPETPVQASGEFPDAVVPQPPAQKSMPGYADGHRSGKTRLVGELPSDQEENLFTPNCIRTVGGRYINLLDPDPETFDIVDIAHALSRIPRFGGHLPVFYSVALHSLTVCTRLHRLSRAEQYQGLMHDASEAYLLDLPTPLKAVLPEYKRIEKRMMERLAARFEFQWPMLATVHLADGAALREEWEDLMLNNVAVAPRDAKDVERMFLGKFKELRP